MPASEPTRRGVPAPVRIALLYAAFGAAWIAIGDLFVWAQGGITTAGLLLELGKGSVFVAASALLLYALVRREVRRRERAATQLERVLDTAPVGIVAVAPDGTIARWNAAATRILGWSEAEVIGRRPSELGLPLHHGPESAGTGGFIDATLTAHNGTTAELRVFTSSDSPADAGARAIVFRDRGPQIDMEAALRQAHKLEAVGRLAGGVAHEFNNVLTTIIGHTQLLADRFDEGDPARQHADEVARAAERAAALTRQLLVFSGKHITRMAPIDLSRMLRDLRAVATRIVGDDIAVEYVLADPVWPVRCDPAQLNQLVLNLLLNAREAISVPGTVTIETSNVNVTRSTGPDPVPRGEYVLLRVSDTGAGMTPETIAHLFEPFFTTKAQGTGLGLSTVYGIVQQCDGHIRVRSRPGRGSSFDIYLPRAGAVEAVVVTDVRPAPRGAAVLVVEDDDAVRDLTCRVLRRRGHQVVAACNGHEALALLNAGADVRLVIADIVMPGMNGIELGNHLRRDFPDLPVLFTSGFVAGGAGEEGGLAPGSNFIPKPFRPAELIARVDELLLQAGGD